MFLGLIFRGAHSLLRKFDKIRRMLHSYRRAHAQKRNWEIVPRQSTSPRTLIRLSC